MTLLGFLCRWQNYWTGNNFIFGIEVPSSIFVMETFLLMLLLKEQFLHWGLRHWPFAMTKLAELMIILYSAGRIMPNFIRQSICLGWMAKKKVFFFWCFFSKRSTSNDYLRCELPFETINEFFVQKKKKFNQCYAAFKPIHLLWWRNQCYGTRFVILAYQQTQGYAVLRSVHFMARKACCYWIKLCLTDLSIIRKKSFPLGLPV